jgi:DNA repair exonuclease SbcCD ATPase subunit
MNRPVLEDGEERIIKDFVNREKASREYQRRLEQRISEDALFVRQARGFCAQLEQELAASEKMRIQLETAVDRVSKEQQLLGRDLTLERNKATELETRIANLLSINNTLLKMVSGKQSSQNPEVDHLLAENERQREFISILQSTNQTNEQAIQTLRIAFTTAFECCPLSESGSNACTVIDEEAYYEPPFPTDSVKEEEGTWYKD